MTPINQGGDMLGWKQMLMVGLGGAFGSLARYKIGGYILHRWPGTEFPLSTLSVNLLGCLAIGILAGLVEQRDFFSPAGRLFLFTGLLGGFTTFSAFGYEITFLLRRSLINLASVYVVASVMGGLAAVWIGMKCVDLVGASH